MFFVGLNVCHVGSIIAVRPFRGYHEGGTCVCVLGGVTNIEENCDKFGVNNAFLLDI